MKLHAFEVGTDRRFRAYTRDRGRKHLQRPILLASGDVRIDPKDWRYVGVISTTGLPLDFVQPLHASVRQQGWVVVSMPPLRTHFHVFDLQLDAADLRIYSHARDLNEFNEYRKRLELSPDGESYRGGEPVHRGELDIPSEASATALRLNYRQLQRHGFDVVVVNAPAREETIRRRLQRELPDVVRSTLQEFGVHLVDLQIQRVTFRQPDMTQEQPLAPPSPPAQSVPPHSININIANTSTANNVTSTGSAPASSAKPRLFDGWIAKLLGLLAAVATILALFKS